MRCLTWLLSLDGQTEQTLARSSTSHISSPRPFFLCPLPRPPLGGLLQHPALEHVKHVLHGRPHPPSHIFTIYKYDSYCADDPVGA